MFTDAPDVAGSTALSTRPRQMVFGRYRLRQLLGRGGMGLVWLACDEELERLVALKFFPDVVVGDRASLHELKREAKRTLELTHPHIVRTFDFVHDAHTAAISMEYVDADTLRNRRIDMPLEVFEPRDLGPWVRQLCEALDYAHQHAAIVHRDLKPANLMINRRDQLKVTDFGIARSLMESMTQITGQGISGTLVYMSPQQLAGEMPQPADDIYSIGATLFELLTTRPPFYSGDIAEQVRHAAVPSLGERRAALGLPQGEIPSSWEETIAACLAKDSSARPQSAGEVAVRLGLLSAAALPPVPAAVVRKVPKAQLVRVPRAGMIAQATEYLTQTTVQVRRKFSGPDGKAMRRLAWAGAGALCFLVCGGLYLDKERAPEVSLAPPSAAPVVPAATSSAGALTGRIRVDSPTPGARISIGALPAQPSPATAEELPAGRHLVRVEAPGYELLERELELRPEAMELAQSYSLARSAGGLKIESDPAGVPIRIAHVESGEVVEGLTPFDGSQLPVGEYEVTALRQGWPEQKQRVTISRGEVAAHTFTFTGGGLLITSAPAGAIVRQGDKVLGQTPLELAKVPPGPVTYEVAMEGFAAKLLLGEVKSGETLALDAVLTGAKSADKNERRRTSSRSSRRSSGSGDILHRAKSGGRQILRILPF